MNIYIGLEDNEIINYIYMYISVNVVKKNFNMKMAKRIQGHHSDNIKVT